MKKIKTGYKSILKEYQDEIGTLLLLLLLFILTAFFYLLKIYTPVNLFIYIGFTFFFWLSYVCSFCVIPALILRILLRIDRKLTEKKEKT